MEAFARRRPLAPRSPHGDDAVRAIGGVMCALELAACARPSGPSTDNSACSTALPPSGAAVASSPASVPDIEGSADAASSASAMPERLVTLWELCRADEAAWWQMTVIAAALDVGNVEELGHY